MLYEGTRTLRGWVTRRLWRDKDAAHASHGLRERELCVRGTLGHGRRAVRAPLGAGPSRGNVRSQRKWGSCPAALLR